MRSSRFRFSGLPNRDHMGPLPANPRFRSPGSPELSSSRGMALFWLPVRLVKSQSSVFGNFGDSGNRPISPRPRSSPFIPVHPRRCPFHPWGSVRQWVMTYAPVYPVFRSCDDVPSRRCTPRPTPRFIPLHPNLIPPLSGPYPTPVRLPEVSWWVSRPSDLPITRLLPPSISVVFL